MRPVSVTSVINKNGVITLYVLLEDGTLMKKAEDESGWSQIDAIPGHRDEQQSKPNLASSNKGRKKRGD
jgi:hypothetical protein